MQHSARIDLDRTVVVQRCIDKVVAAGEADGRNTGTCRRADAGDAAIAADIDGSGLQGGKRDANLGAVDGQGGSGDIGDVYGADLTADLEPFVADVEIGLAFEIDLTGAEQAVQRGARISRIGQPADVAATDVDIAGEIEARQDHAGAIAV